MATPEAQTAPPEAQTAPQAINRLYPVRTIDELTAMHPNDLLVYAYDLQQALSTPILDGIDHLQSLRTADEMKEMPLPDLLTHTFMLKETILGLDRQLMTARNMVASVENAYNSQETAYTSLEAKLKASQEEYDSLVAKLKEVTDDYAKSLQTLSDEKTAQKVLEAGDDVVYKIHSGNIQSHSQQIVQELRKVRNPETGKVDGRLVIAFGPDADSNLTEGYAAFQQLLENNLVRPKIVEITPISSLN